MSRANINYTVGRRINRAIAKLKFDIETTNFDEETKTLMIENLRQTMRKEFEEDLTEAKALDEIYEKVYNTKIESLDSEWFLTVRPRPDVPFEDLKKLTEKFVNKRFINTYFYVFEQKGNDENTLGDGHHVHILITLLKSAKVGIDKIKDEFISSFKKIANPASIKYIVAKRADALIKNYLLDHVSDDGHKELTAETDKKWRTKIGLEEYYTNDPERIDKIKTNEIPCT